MPEHKWVTVKGRTWCLECGESVPPCERSPWGKRYFVNDVEVSAEEQGRYFRAGLLAFGLADALRPDLRDEDNPQTR